METGSPTRQGLPLLDVGTPRWGSGLRCFKTALKDRKTRRINIALIGDSVSEGFASEDTASAFTNFNLQSNMWQHIVRRQLQRMWGGAGVGYVPCGINRSGNTESPAQAQWSPLGFIQVGDDGTAASAGTNHPSDHKGAAMKRWVIPGGTLGTAGGAFMLGITFDRALIYCSKSGTSAGVGNGGSARWYLDDPGSHLSAAHTFDTFTALDGNPGVARSSPAGQPVAAQTYTNLCADTGAIAPSANLQHRLDIGVSGGSDTVNFEGAFFCLGNYSSGIGWWDFTNGGTSTGMWTSADGVADSNGNIAKSQSWDRGITCADPDLVIVSLGLNDFGYGAGGTNTANVSTGTMTGRQPDQYASNLIDIAARIRAARKAWDNSGAVIAGNPPSILFVLPWAARDDAFTDAQWQAYRIAARNAIATIDDAGVVDLYSVLGRPGVTPANYGWISSDHLHPLNSGHHVIAEAVLNYFNTEMLDDVDPAQTFAAGVQGSLSHGAELDYAETTYASDVSTVPNPALTSGSQVNVNSRAGVRLSCSWTGIGRAVDITIGMHLEFSAGGMVAQIVLEDISSGGSAFIGTFDVVGPSIAGSQWYTFKRRFVVGSETTPATPGTAAAPLIKAVAARMQALNSGGSGTVTVNGNLGAGSGQPTFIRVQDC